MEFFTTRNLHSREAEELLILIDWLCIVCLSHISDSRSWALGRGLFSCLSFLFYLVHSSNPMPLLFFCFLLSFGNLRFPSK